MKWSELPRLNKIALGVGLFFMAGIVVVFTIINLIAGLFFLGLYGFTYWWNER